MNPENIVEKGYDKIYRLYDEHRVRRGWSGVSDLLPFIRRLPKQGSVLDVGCGSGYVAAIFERRGFRVRGIDVSKNMLKLARKNAPKSRFRRMNMRRLDFPKNSFDGVVCLYSIFHVPRRFHLGILRSFRGVLKPKGLLAIHMGWGGYVGIEEDFLGSGTALYWSHYGKERNLELLAEAGFKVLLSKPSIQKNGTHLFAVAQKA